MNLGELEKKLYEINRAIYLFGATSDFLKKISELYNLMRQTDLNNLSKNQKVPKKVEECFIEIYRIYSNWATHNQI